MSDETAASVDDQLAEAIEHHRQGELTRAETAYSRVLELDPDNVDAHHLLGVLAHQMGGTAIAIGRVKKSLAIKPDQPRALNNLGNILVDAERAEEAIEQYQRAIEVDPDYCEAYHNLGNVLSDCNRDTEASACFIKALQLQPDAYTSRIALGTTFERLGKPEQAIAEFKTVLEQDPESINAFNRLGALLRKLNRIDEAREVYRQWLQLDPDSPIASHLLAACTPEQAPERASAEYVKTTFDRYAHEFESSLEGLNYQVPQLIGDLVRKHFGAEPAGDLTVGDLGCGTGLCASYLRPYAERLNGIDLSPGMLSAAGEKNVYDHLVEAEMTEYLFDRNDLYDLLVSADTLIYVGDLASTFTAAHQAMRDGGRIAFSIEKLPEGVSDSGYQLQRFGRYAHAESQVRTWLDQAGFDVDELVDAKLRDEGPEAAMGCLVMASKR